MSAIIWTKWWLLWQCQLHYIKKGGWDRLWTTMRSHSKKTHERGQKNDHGVIARCRKKRGSHGVGLVVTTERRSEETIYTHALGKYNAQQREHTQKERLSCRAPLHGGAVGELELVLSCFGHGNEINIVPIPACALCSTSGKTCLHVWQLS